MFFLREEHTNYAKWSATKTQLQVTFYGLNRLYLGLDTYIHICMQEQLVKKETMNLERNGEEYVKGFRGRKEKREKL